MQKNIVLGLFTTDTFHKYASKKENCAYPFTINKVISESEMQLCESVLDIVYLALKNCDICYFILDGMELPINFDREGFTNKELNYILKNKNFYKKTIFIKDNVVYELEDVLKLIK